MPALISAALNSIDASVVVALIEAVEHVLVAMIGAVGGVASPSVAVWLHCWLNRRKRRKSPKKK
jgi:hypothetical protein